VPSLLNTLAKCSMNVQTPYIFVHSSQWETLHEIAQLVTEYTSIHSTTTIICKRALDGIRSTRRENWLLEDHSGPPCTCLIDSIRRLGHVFEDIAINQNGGQDCDPWIDQRYIRISRIQHIYTPVFGHLLSPKPRSLTAV